MESKGSVLISDNCKPKEIILSAALSELYNSAVSKGNSVSISIIRYGAIVNGTNINIFKPTSIAYSEKAYCEMNCEDAMLLAIDFGGDVISITFDE